MSEWTSRVRDHRIWGLMEALGPTIDKAVRLDDVDPVAVEALERLRSVLAFCGKRLGGSEPLTIPLGPLDALAGYLEAEQSEIDAFVSDRDLAHLNNANNSADAALLQLAQVPGISTPEELIGLVNAAASHRTELNKLTRSSEESRRQAQAEIQKLKTTLEAFQSQAGASIADLTAKLDTERQKIASLSAEQQKLFTDAQESRTNTYNDTLLKTQETLTKTLSDQQGQFSTAQENRNRDFTAAQTEAQKRFGDLIADHTKRLADQDAEFTKQRDAYMAQSHKAIIDLDADYQVRAEGILGEVNKRREEVETLVGVIGNLGVTSGYQTTANQARKSMWLWQAVAVTAMGFVILFAYRAFLPSLHGEFKWSGFATRVFLTVTVGVLAAYAVNQADKFFRAEKYNRKLALELAAIDPFIALLPPEEQHKFKLEIGRRSFAQEELLPKGDKSPATTIDVLLSSKQGEELLQLLLELAKKLPKIP